MAYLLTLHGGANSNSIRPLGIKAHSMIHKPCHNSTNEFGSTCGYHGWSRPFMNQQRGIGKPMMEIFNEIGLLSSRKSVGRFQGVKSDMLKQGAPLNLESNNQEGEKHLDLSLKI
ncbi:zinc finger protein 3-like [Cicer arietinum]|uniref:Uncharacterized protein LOC101503863 n=1 Tax=Cicer arietinum TaxID=3827 RepID=A0A1S2YBS1_CICAR|nr:uncharacterized protein LOC101503863 [Cicer arietinum]